MVKKELAFMKAKGAPKTMIKHEKEEAKGKPKGKPFAKGGGIESKGKGSGKITFVHPAKGAGAPATASAPAAQ
jgi:hypothetical protein